MGHYVTGLIANTPLLQKFAAEYRLHAPIQLIGELAILPLRDEDLDSMIPTPQSDHADGFTYLSEQLMAILAEASRDSVVMYFETEYFGGLGGQGAAVFRDGICIFGPERGEIGPINHGLRLLSVTTRSPCIDEFETVGLDRHRQTEDWLGSEHD